MPDTAGIFTPERHHIWCNRFRSGPREGCGMCDELYRDYPPKGRGEEELMAEHFPENEMVE